MGRKKNDQDGAKRKCGNQGKYTGPRLEYLESQVPAFEEAARHGRKSDFWRPLFEGYWSRFDWKDELSSGLVVVKSQGKTSTSDDASPNDANDETEAALQKEVKAAVALVCIFRCCLFFFEPSTIFFLFFVFICRASRTGTTIAYVLMTRRQTVLSTLGSNPFAHALVPPLVSFPPGSTTCSIPITDLKSLRRSRHAGRIQVGPVASFWTFAAA